MVKLAKSIQHVSTISMYVGVVFIVPLMLLTVCDVSLRLLFRVSIIGAFEYSEFLLVIIVWLSFGYVMLRKRHVSMGVLVERLPQRLQIYFDILACLIGLALMLVISWITFGMAISSLQTGEAAEVSKLPLYPFKWILWLGAVVFSLELLAELLLNFTQLWRKGA